MNNLNLFGDSNLNGGNYDHIKIFGSTTVTGEIHAVSMKVFGSSDFNANCDINELNIYGSSTFDEDVKAKKINIKGEANFNKGVNVDILKIYGATSFKDKVVKAEEIKIYGAVDSIIIESDNIQIHGSLNCTEQLNADSIEIKNMDESNIREIVGSNIIIKPKKHWFHKNSNKIIADIIEGDNIELENVECKIVRGNKIKIGPNCTIEKVEFSDTLTVSHNSIVNTKEKN